ncbi:MAG: hypothetical protein WCP30_18990, partial [Mycobacteriaceae bacterium]
PRMRSDSPTPPQAAATSDKSRSIPGYSHSTTQEALALRSGPAIPENGDKAAELTCNAPSSAASPLSLLAAGFAVEQSSASLTASPMKTSTGPSDKLADTEGGNMSF